MVGGAELERLQQMIGPFKHHKVLVGSGPLVIRFSLDLNLGQWLRYRSKGCGEGLSWAPWRTHWMRCSWWHPGTRDRPKGPADPVGSEGAFAVL